MRTDTMPGPHTEKESPTDAELWAALVGDPDVGLPPIYDRYCGLVFGIGLRILGDANDAEDLVQEVFFATVRDRSYDPTRGSLGTFLSMLARSRALDRVRRRSRQDRLIDDFRASPEPSEDRFSPEERTSSMELSRNVSKALAGLPDRQREVLELAYFRGLSQSEIAATLETPLGTVKGAVRGALRNLRGALGHLRS